MNPAAMKRAALKPCQVCGGRLIYRRALQAYVCPAGCWTCDDCGTHGKPDEICYCDVSPTPAFEPEVLRALGDDTEIPF